MLTNAVRHGDRRADVCLSFGPAALEVTVTNPIGGTEAAGVAAPPGGQGLVGMRERAALLGGEVEAGTRDGVFRLSARLPYSGEKGL